MFLCAQLPSENAPNFQVKQVMVLIYMLLKGKNDWSFFIMLREHNVCAA